MATEYRPSIENAANALLTLKRIILITDGRDKVLKTIQYWFRLLSLTYLTSTPLRQRQFSTLLPRLQALISQFSITRKVIRLGHAVESFEGFWGFLKKPEMLWEGKGEQRQLNRLAAIQSVVAIVNDLSDDVCCLSKIGVLDKKWDVMFSPVSARCWFTGIMIDLNQNRADARALDAVLRNSPHDTHELHIKRQWLNWSMWKLIADAVFCSVDVWPKAAVYADGTGDHVQAWSALASAALAFTKLWDKHSKP